MRYIAFNPVHAEMVAEPGEYVWSSFGARAGITQCSWLDPVPGLEAILTGEEESVEAYAAHIKSAIPDG